VPFRGKHRSTFATAIVAWRLGRNRLSPHSRGIVLDATSYARSLRRRLGDGKRCDFQKGARIAGA